MAETDDLWQTLAAASRAAEAPPAALRPKIAAGLARGRRRRTAWAGVAAAGLAACFAWPTSPPLQQRAAPEIAQAPMPAVPAKSETSAVAAVPEVIFGPYYAAVRRPTKHKNVRLYELYPATPPAVQTRLPTGGLVPQPDLQGAI